MRPRTNLTVIFIAVFCSNVHGQSVDESSETPGREIWHAYTEGGVTYGWRHTAVTTLPDGNLRYTVEERVLLEFFGQQQELRSASTYLVTAELEPVAIELEVRRLSGTVHLSGQRRGGSFQLKRESNGIARTATIGARQAAIFRCCLPDWMARHSEQSKLLTNVINEETLQLDVATCIRNDSPASTQDVWSVRVSQGTFESKAMFAFEDERLIKEEFTAPRRTLAVTTEVAASDIMHLKIQPRSLLMLPLNKSIERTDQLKSMLVRVRWKDVPLEMFQFNDARQKVLSHRQDRRQHEVLVEVAVTGDIASSRKQTLLSIDDDQFKPFLTDSAYIRPSDSEIRDAAKRWTADQHTGGEMVRALSTAVSTHLDGGAMIAETLAGPEVLKCRKGKCTEYSTLFASVARAKRIPVRLALGLRMTNGHWVGHMWNEAWIGKWVSVDASVNEIGKSPALLKLTHSDTVLGTQNLRWAVTDSLDVSVLDFELLSTPSDWTTGIIGNTYTNANFECRFTTPRDNWKIENKAKAGQVLLRVRVPDDSVFINFAAYENSSVSAEAVANFRSTQYEKSFKRYEVLRNERVTRNGREWQCLEFQRNVGPKERRRMPNALNMKKSEYIWHTAKSGYIFTIVAEEAAHARHEAEFLRMIESLDTKVKTDRGQQ